MYAVRFDESIRIYDSFAYKETIKEIDGRFYDADEKCWVIPLTKENVATLGMLGATLDEELRALTADSRKDEERAEPIVKPPIKGNLYSHQVKAYNFALERFENGKAVAFLMDMGTGKTITTIALIGALNSQKRIGKVLVVSPKSIVGVWEEEFQKFADFRYALTILDGTIAKKKSAFGYMNGSALQVIVVNYESAWRLENEIAKWQPDMIVCDESSKIKNSTTAQSKALHKLGKKSKYNVILTGTPVTNNPLDFFSQYKFLNEDILGSSYYLFRNRYAVMGGYQNHQIVGYNHLAELVEKVHKVAFRIKIEDAVELPPFIDEVRFIKLEPKAEAVYRMIEQDCYAELSADTEVTARNILTQLLSEPPAYLSAKAKEIYKTVYAWLKSVGCTSGILPYNLEEYAFCKARWLECEEMNTKHGLLVKDPNGKPMPSPFVAMAQQYLKQTNDVWTKIYFVVRESKLSKWDENNPNDDIMEKLLGGKP